MDNPIVLYEVARMRQRDVEKDIAMKQFAMQAQSSRPRLTQRLYTYGESLLKNLKEVQNQQSVSPIEFQFQNTDQK